MNFLELADEVTVRLGVAADDGMLTEAIRKSDVKAALRRVEADVDSPDWLRTTATLTTAAGTGNYAVPAGWSKTLSLRLSTDDHHLRLMGREGLDEVYGATTDNTGTPHAWAQEGGFLYLRPIPDAVVTIEHRYVANETTLSANGDTPLLPARFHDMIVEQACALACRRIGIYDRAAVHEKAYDAWLKTLGDEQSRVTRIPRIRVR